jgi:hypothetical protein
LIGGQLGSFEPGKHLGFAVGKVVVVVVVFVVVVGPQAIGFSHFSHFGASLHAEHSLGAGQVFSTGFEHLLS